MATVAVVGLGNIGTVFAAHLIRGRRHEVIAYVRRPCSELVVDGPYGRIAVSVKCETDPARARPADWVLLSVKTQDTAGAIPLVERLCGQRGRIGVLQNGVGSVPFPRAVPTVIYTNSKRLGPGHFRHMRPEDDLAAPDSEDGHALQELFEETEIRIRTEADFTTAAWRKFLINLAANPLTAIAGRGIGVLRQPDMEALARELLREGAAVGRAAGARLEENAADDVLRWLAGFPADTGTSMLEDRLAGKPLEHEAITGTAVRLGRKFGIPTPANDTILALLRGLDPS